MEFGLQKIVLIDSYVEGRASEIDVSGHTNINGDNGIGKTSFLKLVPIFYGEQPRRLIVESANGNEGFNQFYLPRTGSYVVFEYLSHGRPRMAVFCNRQHEARHRHVFIDSPYRKDLFIDVENGQILPAYSLISRLSAAGIQHMNVDTTQQYRQILLDGTVPKAYHFSMCPRNSRMSKLTPLFTGMFKRDVQFADLSRVIQEYAMDKLDDDARQILENFSVHRDHLTATLTQYDAYQALEKARPESDQLNTLLDEYTLTTNKLSAVVVAAKARETDLGIEVRTHEEAIGELEGTIGREENAHSEVLARLDEEKSTIERTRGPVATHVDDLTRNKTSYDQHDMSLWQKKLAGINQLVGRHESYHKQLQLLKEKSDSIRQPIEEEMATTRERAREEIDRLTERFKELTSRHQVERKQITDRHSQAIREQSRQHQSAASALQAQLGELNSTISRLEERSQHPQASTDLIRQYAIAETAKENAQEKFDSTQEEQADASQKLSGANERYRLADERFTRARNHCEKVEQEYNEVLGLINGEESSLIYFLNENKPGWQNTLGRVLDPEILRKKNLSPSIDEHTPDSNALCGVVIDFARLPEQELTPAALQARLEELSEDVATAEAEEESAEKVLGRANTDRTEAKERDERCTRNYRRQLGELKDARKTLESIRRSKEQSELDNKAAVDRELKGLYDERTAISTQLEELQGTQQSESDQLTARHEAELEAFDRTHDEALAGVDTDKQAAITTRDQDIKRLRDQLSKALSGEGIDPAEMQALQKQVDKLHSEIQAIRAKEVMVISYQRFMKDEYSQLPGLKDELSAFDKQLDELRQQRVSERNRWASLEKDLSKRIEQAAQRKAQASSDANALRVSILQTSDDRELFVREDDENLALYREMKAGDLIQDYQTLLQRESGKINELKKLGTRFATIFEKFSGTPSTQYWQEAELDWDGTAAQVITRARAILEYFNGGKHDLVHETLVSGFSNLDQIDIYRRAMEGFDKRIRRFNRELASHIQQNLNFPAIERVEPTVSFELEELDYWKDIKTLADGVRAWRDNAPLNSLPDEELVLTLRNYLDTFEESRANIAVKELWRLIRFRFSIIENGKHKTGSSSKDLAGSEGLSSNGLSYIVLIVLFLGFVDMQRNGQPVHLSWALDELRAFSNKNKRVLLDLLTDHNISLVTACPDMEDRELSIFNQTYMMDRSDGGRRFIRWNIPEPGAVAANNPFKDIGPDVDGQQGEA